MHDRLHGGGMAVHDASTAKEKDRNNSNSYLHKQPYGGGQNISTKKVRKARKYATKSKQIKQIIQRVTQYVM